MRVLAVSMAIILPMVVGATNAWAKPSCYVCAMIGDETRRKACQRDCEISPSTKKPDSGLPVDRPESPNPAKPGPPN